VKEVDISPEFTHLLLFLVENLTEKAVSSCVAALKSAFKEDPNISACNCVCVCVCVCVGVYGLKESRALCGCTCTHMSV